MNTYLIYRNQRYFHSLDGVRFFSILAVIWHHSLPGGLSEVWHRGFLGVDMFFVLSGYLIVTLLLREKSSNAQKISLKGFYIRRALRIFPVYFGMLLGLSIIYGLLKPQDPDSDKFFSLLPIYLGFIANWSLVQASNIGIYWSLAAEEQFYLCWPLVEKLFSPKAILSILAVFMVINQLVNFGYLDQFFMWLYGQESIVELHILDSTFMPICLGVLLAHSLHNEKLFLWVYRYLGARFSSLLLFVLLFTVITFSSGDLSGFKRLSIQLMMFLWLASLVIREDHIFKRVMLFAPIKRIGQISYGMYVYHMIALHIVREILQHLGLPLDYSLFILGLSVTFIIAELSFRLYESPILSFSKHFKAKHQ